MSAAGKTLEDDGNYGSAATRDVEVLQALSRRIHFGKKSIPKIFPVLMIRDVRV
jgi:hypothetical protein